MLDMTIGAIAAAVGGTLRNCLDADVVIKNVVTDSRKVDAESLFIPLRGERFDGHDFLKNIAGKVAAVFCSDFDKCPNGVACIEVSDTLVALQELANCHRRQYNLPVIAVTGSNGKTTTKEMIDAVLSEKFKVLKNEGNLNNEIGLPLTLLRLNGTHQAAVVEMGMRGSGQITELCNIAEPTAAVVTNVGETHIELLGNIDNIAAAKTELPEWLAENSLLVLNNDDERVAAMAERSKGRAVRCGLKGMPDVRAANVVATAEGLKFDVYLNGEQIVFSCALPAVGIHNVNNALLAIAAGWELGLSAAEIVAGLAKYNPADMRMQVVQKRGVTIIADCYNSSPLSMNAALETLALFSGRKVVMLADMLELGEHAKALHARVGEKAAVCGVEAVLTFGEKARCISDAARDNGVKNVQHFDARRNAAEYLAGYLRRGDVLLIKGSRGMALEEIMNELLMLPNEPEIAERS